MNMKTEFEKGMAEGSTPNVEMYDMARKFRLTSEHQQAAAFWQGYYMSARQYMKDCESMIA